MMQKQDRLSPSVSDTAHPGSISSQSTLVTQTLGSQPSNVRDDVHATTSTFNDAQLSMNMETSLLENPPSVSFASGKLVPSYQDPTPSASQDLAKTVQEPVQDFSDGHIGSRGDSDAANSDKEATILAPQVVSTYPLRRYPCRLTPLKVNWEHHGNNQLNSNTETSI